MYCHNDLMNIFINQYRQFICAQIPQQSTGSLDEENSKAIHTYFPRNKINQKYYCKTIKTIIYFEISQ